MDQGVDEALAEQPRAGPSGQQPRRSLARHLSEVQLLLDQAPSFLALTQGQDHVVTIANAAYLRLVGRTREEVLGKPIGQTLPELKEQGLEQLLNEVLASETQRVGSAVRIELRTASHGAATQRRVDFILQPIFDAASATVGILIQGLDVTDREMAIESLQQADRRKDTFLATLAHEMLSPLSASRVALESLVRLRGNAMAAPEATRLFGILQRQYASLSGLVEDLLDVTRIKLGKVALRVEDVMVQDAVRAAAETCQHTLDARSHSLQLQLPESPLFIRADRRRLIQVLTNVLMNAAKYTPSGGKISIEVGQTAAEAEIIILDNGRGMTPRQTERAFELFQQNSKDDSLSGGLGIGLALVRQLVELQGGTVHATSAGISAGTAITVRLPLVRA